MGKPLRIHAKSLSDALAPSKKKCLRHWPPVALRDFSIYSWSAHCLPDSCQKGWQQVDHSCPTGLHWEISPFEHSRSNLKAETHEWTSSLPSDKYDVTFTGTHVAIRAKILTDASALLTWSPQNPSPFVFSPQFACYDILFFELLNCWNYFVSS